ncbi:MAG TPA: serine/threonine-protein kinase, partial [Herpetosiphonaceae bacterium]|nr:serine/threonine-protein kinase [Herpetosiphonaceae bacterium]
MSEITCYQCQAPLQPSAATCPKCGLPQILRGRYRIRRLLGQGGFGVVYEAVDLDLNRHYAIKLITATSPAIREQVAIEAQILAQHARRLPFMPEIYDIWSDTGRTALVMEYIDGATLGDLIEQHGAWPANVVGRFLYTILNDLDRLHGLGIVHRDIKPDNIKRTADGRYVLLDFGIAKRDNSTQSGAKAFSLYYASPEQASGKATDVRSDLYSLGATAYHLLTGNAPAPGNARQVMDARLHPPSHFYPRTPAVLNDLIMRMLELGMDDRPPSAKAALQMLTAKAPSGAAPAPPAEAVIAHAPAPFSSAGMATQVVRPAEPAPSPPSPAAPPAAAPGRPRWAMWLLAALLLAALGG